MDLVVGAYDDISSADVPGFTDAIMAAMPGLIEHRCSIGSRGGFRTRLRRGTYAPHIIEHVALELQTMVGHDVGYGRTRGGDVEGEYTLVFEHIHEQVGLRAAALALEVVQRAFAGTLENVESATSELRALAETTDSAPIEQRVLCGVTGGSLRAETQQALRHDLERFGLLDSDPERSLAIDVSPAFLLQAGLPYARSEMAIILDADLTDVPERYQDPERARRLVGTVCDAVWRDGLVVCPAKEWEIQDYAREQDCRVAIFSTSDDVSWRDARVAVAVGRVRGDHIVVERDDEIEETGEVRADVPLEAQVAAAVAAVMWREDCRARTGAAIAS